MEIQLVMMTTERRENLYRFRQDFPALKDRRARHNAPQNLPAAPALTERRVRLKEFQRANFSVENMHAASHRA